MGCAWARNSMRIGERRTKGTSLSLCRNILRYCCNNTHTMGISRRSCKFSGKESFAFSNTFWVLGGLVNCEPIAKRLLTFWVKRICYQMLEMKRRLSQKDRLSQKVPFHSQCLATHPRHREGQHPRSRAGLRHRKMFCTFCPHIRNRPESFFRYSSPALLLGYLADIRIATRSGFCRRNHHDCDQCTMIVH